MSSQTRIKIQVYKDGGLLRTILRCPRLGEENDYGNTYVHYDNKKYQIRVDGVSGTAYIDLE